MLTVYLELAVQVPCLLRCKTHALWRMPSILRDLHREGATLFVKICRLVLLFVDIGTTFYVSDVSITK